LVNRTIKYNSIGTRPYAKHERERVKCIFILPTRLYIEKKGRKDKYGAISATE